MTKLNEYDQQAADFVENTGVKIEKYFTGYREHFPGDNETRPCWQITLHNKNGSYSFAYGDSIQHKLDCTQLFHSPAKLSKKYPGQVRIIGHDYVIVPTDYDILACLDVREDCDDIDDFMVVSAKEASRVMQLLKEQTEGLEKLFSEDQLDALMEIA